MDIGTSDELEEIFFEFISSGDTPDPQILQEFIEHYPQYEHELVEFATAWARDRLSPPHRKPSEEGDAELIAKAMRQIDDLLEPAEVVLGGGPWSGIKLSTESQRDHQRSKFQVRAERKPYWTSLSLPLAAVGVAIILVGGVGFESWWHWDSLLGIAPQSAGVVQTSGQHAETAFVTFGAAPRQVPSGAGTGASSQPASVPPPNADIGRDAALPGPIEPDQPYGRDAYQEPARPSPPAEPPRPARPTAPGYAAPVKPGITIPVHRRSQPSALHIAGIAGELNTSSPPVQEPGAAAAPYGGFLWSGPYVGLNLGGGWGSGNTRIDGPSDLAGFVRAGPSGAIGGAQIGYNLSLFQGVFGLEADIQGSGLDGARTAINGSTTLRSSEALHWLATFRARAGFEPADRVLVYGTGGLAVGGVRLVAASTSSSPAAVQNPQPHLAMMTSKVGWAGGAGAEWAFTDQMSAKLEYMFVDLGAEEGTINTSSGSVRSIWQNAANIIRVGLNTRF